MVIYIFFFLLVCIFSISFSEHALFGQKEKLLRIILGNAMLGGGPSLRGCVTLEKRQPSGLAAYQTSPTLLCSAHRPRWPIQALTHLFAQTWYFPTVKSCLRLSSTPSPLPVYVLPVVRGPVGRAASLLLLFTA